MNILLILTKLRILKITLSKIQKWSKNKNLKLLKYAAQKGDFRCRKEVAKNLATFKYSEIESILINLLHDKVFTVAESAIVSLKKFNLTESTKIEIQSVLNKWKSKESKMKMNWNSLDSDFQGLYIDKTKMKRLKELKYWMAKFKGSMSIG